MRRFAATTTVAVSKSRGEIDKLLRDWKADGIQWSDDYRRSIATLRFMWHHDNQAYLARISIQLPTKESLEHLARDGRTGRTSDVKMRKVLEGLGRSEHRLLLLWLKACFNAIEAGIVSAEAIFLPFLEGADGQTVGEIAIPRMETLLSGSATNLLPAHDGK